MLSEFARAVRRSVTRGDRPSPSSGAPSGDATPDGVPAGSSGAPLPTGASPREQARETLRRNLASELAQDARRFVKYSIPVMGPRRLSRMQGMRLDASATRLYHRVEKGFSLPDPRRPFGEKAVPGLQRVLANTHTDPDALYAVEARSVLAALEAWNEHGVRVDEVAPRGDSLPQNPIDAATAARFITSRHSVRDFAPQPVGHELVSEAVRVAMSAPSVCNRQAWRAYWFDEPDDLARVLALHGGSAGFAESIPGLFVITFDLRAFEGVNERHQGWVDGGLFSMNLLLALHGLGLAAVPLNWSRSNHWSALMRDAAGLAPYEEIVMLVAAGHPNPDHRVARSARRPLEQVLRFGMPADG